MRAKIPFILNDTSVVAEMQPGMVLANYIRYEARLTGTKIGCREGDCGACTVLVGELGGSADSDEIVYRNVNSCLMPIGNAAGCHVVTIEGVDLDRPNAIQEAFVEEGATQCGFCTPGFIVSLVGHCLERECRDPLAAISGNICRCTGYKSIERAATRVVEHLKHRGGDLVEAEIVPAWFASIPERLRELKLAHPACEEVRRKDAVCVGGGTDLYVQRPDELEPGCLQFNLARAELRGIRCDGNTVILGASVTMEEVSRSTELIALFPDLPRYAKLIASQAIRNMATLAGNIANASPIGDMTIFFLALDSSLTLRSGDQRRTVALREFFRGYKDTALEPDEEIESVEFAVPENGDLFSFEKVSKRTCLDIASVNTAMSCRVQDGVIAQASVSAGGVAPIPLYLEKTSAFLVAKMLDAATVREAADIADGEIAPISDVRGSAAYKRLLFRQLFYAHFIVHCEGVIEWGELL